MKSTSVLFICFVFLGLTACEDPSNVGIGLIGGEGGEPVVATVQAETFEPIPMDDVTGDLNRVLSGAVDDPLFGMIAAAGYLDFGAVALRDGFEDNPVTSARLRLRRDYVYGDTTSQLTFTLRSMPQEWTATGASPDTTVEAGSVITEFTMTAADTLVDVALPQEWISANDAILRGSSFIENFHGFQVSASAGNAVVGFSTSGTTLRAYTASDSAIFSVSKSLSTLRRTGDPTLPPDRIGMQDGIGPASKLVFDLAGEELQRSGVNRAVLRVSVDQELMEPETPGFVRPAINQLDLYGVTDAEEAIAIERASLDTTGVFTFQSGELRRQFQQIILGERTFERFELRIPLSAVTINALTFYDTGVAERAPVALFTLTRVQ